MNAPPADSRQADGERPRRSRLRVAARILTSLALALAAFELVLWGVGTLVASGIQDRRADPGGVGARFTILVVGDSWAQGAPTGRFPDYVVDALNRRQTAVRYRYVNVGRAGTNSSQALGRLIAALERERPDLLLLITGNNDHHNLTASTYWKFRDERLGPGSILAARARIAMHSLRTYRLAKTLWQVGTGGPTANEFFAAETEGAAAERDGLIAIDHDTHRKQLDYNLTRFVEIAREENLPIVFQTYFHFHGYRVNEIVRDVAARYDVPLVDHNYLFHTRIPELQRASYRIPDGHPSPHGYALMADFIVETFDTERLLP